MPSKPPASGRLPRCVLVLVLLACTLPSLLVATQLKRYSYLCLKARPNLCLGVSTGAQGMPYAGMALQLKPRINNANQGLDYKKMRWNMDPSPSALRLTNISHLCVDYVDFRTPLNLFECQDGQRAVWDFDEQVGVIRYNGSNLCMTSHVCTLHADPAQSCSMSNLAVETVATNILPGAGIFLNGCFDMVNGKLSSQASQVWQQDLDCAAGCSPDMAFNGACDLVCDTTECLNDHGQCALPPTTPPPAGGAGAPAGNELPPQTDPFQSEWLGLSLLMLIACCAACAARRRRRLWRQSQHPMQVTPEQEEDGSDNSQRHSLEQPGGEIRFKSTAAVALNQLRYHTRVAGEALRSVKRGAFRSQPVSQVHHEFDEVQLL